MYSFSLKQFFFQAEAGIRERDGGLEFRRVLCRSQAEEPARKPDDYRAKNELDARGRRRFTSELDPDRKSDV